MKAKENHGSIGVHDLTPIKVKVDKLRSHITKKINPYLTRTCQVEDGLYFCSVCFLLGFPGFVYLTIG